MVEEEKRNGGGGREVVEVNEHRQHRSSTGETPQSKLTASQYTHGGKKRHIARYGRMRGMPEILTMLGQPAFQLSFFGKSHRHPNPIQRSGKEDMDNVCQRLTFCCKPNPNWKPKDKHNGRITSLLSFRYSHSLKCERGIKILFKVTKEDIDHSNKELTFGLDSPNQSKRSP